jgi:hypothetical protein
MGDNLNNLCLFEMDAVPHFMAFHPSRSMLNSDVPKANVNMVSLSKQELIVLNGWLSDEE